MPFGEKPFGLRGILIKKGAAAAIALPVARKMTFTPIVQTGELRGDDVIAENFSSLEGMDIDLEAGGISIDAWATLTGQAIPAATGVAPNQKWTVTSTGGDVYPYVKIGGQVRASDGGAIEVIFYKCQVTSIQGAFNNGEFVVTTLKMKAIPDSGVSNKIYDIISYQTAVALALT